jgi:predicted XRE-type DNA-binding protein
MNIVSVLVICSILMIASLFVVSFVNHQHTRKRVVTHKVWELRRRINELEEVGAAIEPLVESPIIPKIINDEIIDLIHTTTNLDPSIIYLESNLRTAQALSESYLEQSSSSVLYRVQPSDAAIARAQHYLQEAGRIVRSQQVAGRINSIEMDQFISELGWAHLMVEVLSHISQGHKALSRSDVLSAYGYYRNAVNKLMTSTVSDERKHRLIREVSEILQNKRKSVSLDLMPESTFNPASSTPDLPQQGM